MGVSRGIEYRRNWPAQPRSARDAAVIGRTGVLALCLLLMTPSPAAAGGKPQQLAFVTDLASYQSQDPVEQQSPDFFFWDRSHPQTWVTNRTGCVWDIDDDQERITYSPTSSPDRSYMAPGQQATDDRCVIADWDGYNYGPAHFAVLSFRASSANLAVTLTVTPGYVITATPVYDPTWHDYLYTGCRRVPTYQPGDPMVQAIPNSNGGWGVPTTAMVSIMNTDAKKNVYVWGSWGIVNGWIALWYDCAEAGF